MGSVENVDGDFKIDRIAIIGAGAAGLAAATYVFAPYENLEAGC